MCTDRRYRMIRWIRSGRRRPSWIWVCCVVVNWTTHYVSPFTISKNRDDTSSWDKSKRVWMDWSKPQQQVRRVRWHFPSRGIRRVRWTLPARKSPPAVLVVIVVVVAVVMKLRPWPTEWPTPRLRNVQYHYHWIRPRFWTTWREDVIWIVWWRSTLRDPMVIRAKRVHSTIWTSIVITRTNERSNPSYRYWPSTTRINVSRC